MQSFDPVFVEDWLKSCSQSTSNRLSVPAAGAEPPPSSATTIIQAWSQIRNCLQGKNLQRQHLLPFRTLVDSRASLRVADAQVKLLLSAFALHFPPEVAQDFCSLILRILYIWVRKSMNPNVSLLESAVSVARDVLSRSGDKGKVVGDGILFLGAVSSVPVVPESSRKVCLGMVQILLDERGIGDLGVTAEVLGGIGYSLLFCQIYDFDKIIDWFLNVWDGSFGFCLCISHGLMIFHLNEWLVSRFISSGSWEKIELLLDRMGEKAHVRQDDIMPFGVEFVLVMSAGGVLRGLSRGSGRKEIAIRLKKSADNVIETVMSHLVAQTGVGHILGKAPLGEFGYLDHGTSNSVLLRCIALCLCRCGPISFHADVLTCLTLALLNEVLPLLYFYDQVLMNSSESLIVVLSDEIGEHLESILFIEAGIVTRVFCNLYVLADEEQKLAVENCIWHYCDKICSKHRQLVYTFEEKSELLKRLEKIGEAAFLMTVIFASIATKHKAGAQFTSENQLRISLRILSAFSCMECFRQVRISEYADTVKCSVLCIKDDSSACSSLVETVPSYVEITNQQGWNMNYIWFKDKVLTARILFYLRVLPLCAEQIPTSVFEKILAALVFLYMGHPDGKVARASHSLFSAFISSGKDSLNDHRTLLKEKLTFYYMQRSLEGYPGVTPFEGMASGVVTLIRHLPAGSAAIFYCLHSIVEKARVMSQSGSSSESQQERSDPWKKLIEFLPRLIFLVDIQVLPSLLKLLSELIVHLKGHALNILLDDIYALVSESDDVTRKPLLVSWVQSVTYLSSQAEKINSSKHVHGNSHTSKAVGKGLDNDDYSSQTPRISHPNSARWSYFLPGSRL